MNTGEDRTRVPEERVERLEDKLSARYRRRRGRLGWLVGLPAACAL
jgi:hypothetical protein